MKKLVALLLVALLTLKANGTLSAHSSVASKKEPRNDIYVAIRTDGATGSGTTIDPFDGSTSAKLDEILRKIANNTTVHFGPGTFPTDGFQNHSDSLGFTVKQTCKYVGAGRDKTVIKLITALGGNGSSHQGFVFYSGDANADVSGAEVRNLTVDCNAAELVAANSSDFRTYGVSLEGSNCSISNVHLIHMYGHEATGAEAFGLGIKSGVSGGHNVPSTNALIENCLVDTFAPGNDHGQMICLSGGASTLSGKIRGCTVTGQATGTSAYQLYGSRAQMENDVSINCRNFLYMDEGNIDHVTIQNCHGYGITGDFINFSPAVRCSHRDITIRNCTAEFLAGGAFLVANATPVGASISNIQLTNNTATRSATGRYTPLNLIKVRGFHASNNHWRGQP